MNDKQKLTSVIRQDTASTGLLPWQPGKEYYGISWSDGKGGIVYKAAATLLDDSEKLNGSLNFSPSKKGNISAKYWKITGKIFPASRQRLQVCSPAHALPRTAFASKRK